MTGGRSPCRPSSSSEPSTPRGSEYAYLADRLREHGVEVVLVDAGIAASRPTPDVTREEVAAAAGADVAALAAAGDRGAAVDDDGPRRGGGRERLHAEGRLDAIGGLGGSGGSALVTTRCASCRSAFQADGVDRRVGRYPPYVGVGRRDDDVLGRRHRRRERGVGADHGERRGRARGNGRRDGAAARREAPLVVASMFGVTTPRSRSRASGSRSSATRCSSSTRPGQGAVDGEAPRGRVRWSGRSTSRRPSSATRSRAGCSPPCPERLEAAGQGRDPPGRVARCARHGQLRADGVGPRALSRPEPLRPQPDDHPDADDAGRVPRDRRGSSPRS